MIVIAILVLQQVSFHRKDKEVLQGISFEVETGDRIGILGASGAGKTTLLRLLNGLETPSAGQLFFRDQPLSAYEPSVLRRAIGYVLQKPLLFGKTIAENLTYPFELHKKKVNWQEINHYLEAANLPRDIVDKPIHALSGGEQQRIALIRSLLVRPDVLLLDEVTASLDEANTLLIETLLRQEQREKGLTILFISHNIPQAKRLAGKILHLSNKEARLYDSADDYFAQGEVEEYLG